MKPKKKGYAKQQATFLKIEDAIKGTEIARKNNIDTIVSIGGGSVIDIAKLILAFLKPGQDIEKIITKKNIKNIILNSIFRF